MFLQSLNLQSFRNYPKKEFKFSSGTTLVVGPNTAGKTNLLEAIYLLATGKSFRAGVEREMISYGEEIARVRGKIQGQEGREELEIVLTTGQLGGERVAKKKYLVNRVSRRMMDFVGYLRCVLFGPEDLEIVIDSPSVRRGYLDGVLEQVDRDYRRASLSYQKGLRQRNKILESYREAKLQSVKERISRQLYFWNNLLIKNGEIITQKREEYINFINQQPDHFGQLRIDYDKSIISPQRLEKYAKAEVAVGMTLVGPHRDDMKFRLKIENEKLKIEEKDLSAYGSRGESRKSRDLSIYGSRGEQRTAVFSLKLAELEFVAEKAGERPVLLLDDILSELDQEHRARIFEVIPKQQTIITTTDLNLVEKKQRKRVEIINL